MADMLADGLAYLTTQLAQYASQTVLYARGVESVEVRATFGQKLLRLDDGEGGTRVEWTDMDFVFPSADLDFGAGPVTPERGDFLYVTFGYDVETFEVRPVGGDAPWRWSDPHRTQIRVHTVHVENEAYS